MIYAVLGGMLEKDASNHWRSVGYDFTDMEAGERHCFRVIAAMYLWKDDRSSRIIVLGGRGQLNDVLPKDISISSVLKEELVSHVVDDTAIMEEKSSGNTFEQLQWLANLNTVKEHLAIISNDWHLPRIRAMITHLPSLQALHFLPVTLISAEKVLLGHDYDRWSQLVENATASDQMSILLQKEADGVRAIIEGRYVFQKNAQKEV